MAESDDILRKKVRFSSSLFRDSTSQNLITSKLQNQSNCSSQTASIVPNTGNRFRTDLRHHHSSLLTCTIDTKFPRASSCVMMKNLHLRRVFSPSSVSSDWDIHIKGENRTKELDNSTCDPPNFNVTRGEGIGGLVAPVDDFEAVESSQTDSEIFSVQPSLTRIEAGSTCQEINGASGIKVGTNISSKRIRHPEKIFKNPSSVSYRRLLPYLMGAADGLRDSESKKPKNERGELMAEKNCIPETEPVWQFANSSVKPHGNSSPAKKMTSSSTANISRKLFKVPGSANYRRMLLYLKETSEDNPGTPETNQHTDPPRTNVEENAPATENEKGIKCS